ncbi:MAG TPA: hypothetical protein VN442_16555 [Bryobacteraceae bacterium]|nr:hypothetical protein [Bryobacteraceae bacterium]
MKRRIKPGRAGKRRAGPVIPLTIPHTRCPRCHVWARRDPCPHCGGLKALAGVGK